MNRTIEEGGQAGGNAYGKDDPIGAGSFEGEGAKDVSSDVGDGGKIGADEEPATEEAFRLLRLGEEVVIELHAQPHGAFHFPAKGRDRSRVCQRRAH